MIPNRLPQMPENWKIPTIHCHSHSTAVVASHLISKQGNPSSTCEMSTALLFRNIRNTIGKGSFWLCYLHGRILARLGLF